MRLIDTHCHPQMDDFRDDQEAVIKRSLEQGIGMVIVGTTLADSVETVRLAEKYPSQPVYTSVGVHPTDGDLGEIHPAQLAALMGSSKLVAIGECGLDYYRLEPDDAEPRQLQADVFEQHVLLAAQTGKPLLIHTRDRVDVFDAYDDMLTILTRLQFKRFVMHCYSGDWAHAEQFLELGGLLSFTGILTFPKSEMMQDVARRAPLDRIMVETDAPFLAPVPHRGQRNESAYVAFVAEKLAEIRGVSVEEIQTATTANAKKFFLLP